MNTINLEQIISSRGLDKKEVAKHLFPNNKFPDLSLNRVMSGKAVLDANQISKLALMSGLGISQLFIEKEWDMKKDAGVFKFYKDSFKVELDSKTWITKIFDGESLLHDSILHSEFIPLDEYLKQINLIINKYKQNETN